MESCSRWRALVVDDEPPAQQQLLQLLAAHPGFEAMPPAENGIAAITTILNNPPDVVFLDVQMPGLGGFDVIDRLGRKLQPLVVFVTAYEGYAVRAYEVGAIDYLVKPITEARFASTITRVAKHLEVRGARAHRHRATADDDGHSGDQFVVRYGQDRFLLPLAAVEWCEAEDNYIRLHTSRGSFLVRGKISGLERRLDAGEFMRVHRSALVRTTAIRTLVQTPQRRPILVLASGARVGVSGKYRKRVRDMISARDVLAGLPASGRGTVSIAR